jgi:hypothetical protein
MLKTGLQSRLEIQRRLAQHKRLCKESGKSKAHRSGQAAALRALNALRPGFLRLPFASPSFFAFSSDSALSLRALGGCQWHNPAPRKPISMRNSNMDYLLFLMPQG